MAYLNGRLPGSVLAPVPGGHLRRDAAAALNALNVEMKRRYGVFISLPSYRAYRPYHIQVLIRARNCAAGRCYMAAVPGTSNHGWGLAGDLLTKYVRWCVDQIGARYGWAKKWSDASWEWWHLKWRPGVWKGTVPPSLPTLRKGYVRPRKYTRLVQRLLKRIGYRRFKLNGKYDRATRAAVKRFQRRQGLRGDGVVGPRTWALLLKHRKKK